jgi:hypothetical protein
LLALCHHANINNNGGKGIAMFKTVLLVGGIFSFPFIMGMVYEISPLNHPYIESPQESKLRVEKYTRDIERICLKNPDRKDFCK